MIVLECKKIKFYSELDELVFFERLRKIPSIKNYEGEGTSLFIHINSKEVPKDHLLELIALFYRYKVNMKQLGVFGSEKNNSWFKVKGKYWYRKIFL